MRSRIWPSEPRETVGIDWRGSEQIALVRDGLARLPELDFPTRATGDPTEYHTDNEFFSRLDAWALHGMLRHLRPARMIEVGCGWSSLVTAQVNREYLGGRLDFTCIEPYPPEFLSEGMSGISRLLKSPVQEVPVERFSDLQAGDILFIDTSHVIKTGGDVQYLYHEIVPRLAAGVVVHIHDIFLPWDYPREWVMVGRAWNEQYLVQSFLAFNNSFDILLSIAWLSHFEPALLAEVIPGFPDSTPDGGGSIWLRRRVGVS
jgi:hypothetical protein